MDRFFAARFFVLWGIVSAALFVPAGSAQADEYCQSYQLVGNYPVAVTRTYDDNGRYALQTASINGLMEKSNGITAAMVWRPGEDGDINPPVKVWFVPGGSRLQPIYDGDWVDGWPSTARLAKRENHFRKAPILGTDMGKDVARVVEVDPTKLLNANPGKPYLKLEMLSAATQKNKRLWPRYNGELNLKILQQLLESNDSINTQMAALKKNRSSACSKKGGPKPPEGWPHSGYIDELNYTAWNSCGFKIADGDVHLRTDDRRIRIYTNVRAAGTAGDAHFQMSFYTDEFKKERARSKLDDTIFIYSISKDLRDNPLKHFSIWSENLVFEDNNMASFRSHIKWPMMEKLLATGEPIGFKLSYENDGKYMTGVIPRAKLEKMIKLVRRARLENRTKHLDPIKYCDLPYPEILI